MNVSFIICFGEIFVWVIEVDEIDLLSEDGWGEIYNIVLCVFDILVFYIFYFMFLLDDCCKLGLLMFNFLSFGCYGIEIIMLYYWNIVLNYDVIIMLCYMFKWGL